MDVEGLYISQVTLSYVSSFSSGDPVCCERFNVVDDAGMCMTHALVIEM